VLAGGVNFLEVVDDLFVSRDLSGIFLQELAVADDGVEGGF